MRGRRGERGLNSSNVSIVRSRIGAVGSMEPRRPARPSDLFRRRNAAKRFGSSGVARIMRYVVIADERRGAAREPETITTGGANRNRTGNLNSGTRAEPVIPHPADQFVVVPAKRPQGARAGTHEHRAIESAVFMGPRFRGDDSGERIRRIRYHRAALRADPLALGRNDGRRKRAGTRAQAFSARLAINSTE